MALTQHTQELSVMAAVLVQIRGVLYDLLNRTSQQVVLQGEASVLGLGVGGGPIIPPEGGGGAPDHIWGGGNVPMPTPPIANVPGAPGYRPPGDHIWGPTDPRPTPPIALPPGYPGAPPHVEHPIVLPPTLPDLPAPPEGATKPPPADQGGWGYYEGRWGYFPGPGEPGPKA